MLESVTRGIDRLEAVLKRIDPNTVQALLTKLQVPSLGQIADIKTLQNVVLGLEPRPVNRDGVSSLLGGDPFGYTTVGVLGYM